MGAEGPGILLRRKRTPPCPVAVPGDGLHSELGETSASLSSLASTISSLELGDDDALPSTSLLESADVAALQRLNASLVAALRAERARSRALADKLSNMSESAADNASAAADAAAQQPSPPLSRPPSSTGQLRRSSSLPSAAVRSLSRSLRLPLAPRSANSGTTQHPAAPVGGTGGGGGGAELKARRPARWSAKRTRVVVEPVGAPRRVGMVIDATERASPVAPTELTPTAEAAPPPTAAPPPLPPPPPDDPIAEAKWPEPLFSPPRRAMRSKAKQQQQTPQRAPTPIPLSDALAARVRTALGDELQRLQERVQAALSADPPPAPREFDETVTSLSRRIGWLRSDLNALLTSHANAANGGGGARADEDDGSDSLETLLDLASASDEFVLSLRSELAASKAAEAEQAAATAQCARMGMRIESIRHDGDCLFACAHRWLEAQRDATGADGRTAASEVGALCESPADVRSLVVDMMRERAAGGAADERELASRIEGAVRTALRSHQALDGTSVALRAAATAAVASGDGGPLPKETLREAYFEAMAQSGVFGERLEIELLSSLLGVPVHVHYFVGSGAGAGEGDAAPRKAAAPNEVIAAPGVDKDAMPLRLLHLVHERHFDLLLPPPPQQQTSAAIE